MLFSQSDAFVEKLSVVGLFAFIALLPFARLSELGVLLCLIASGVAAFKNWPDLKQRLRDGFAAQAFGCVFVAALCSMPDSVNVKESIEGTFGLLRFIGLIIAATLLTPALRTSLGRWIFFLVLFWLADAIVQGLTGYGLRGQGAFDRATGLFGQDNPKLGLVLGALSPLALFYAPNRRLALLLVWPMLAIAILMAGARAGWIMFAVATMAWAFKLVNYSWRKTLKLAAVGVAFVGLCTTGLYFSNDKFASRVDRTAQAFQKDGLDHALAGRLPIWQTAYRMAQTHWINGAGVRGFRYAYPAYAQAGDPWVRAPGGAAQGAKLQGATHPHQLFLEIASETGYIGLLCWLWAAVLAYRSYYYTLHSAWPYACALCVLLFPINTHTAMYSSFWAGVLWFLVAMTSATWQQNPEPEEEEAPYNGPKGEGGIDDGD